MAREYRWDVDAQIARWKHLRETTLVELDRALAGAGLAAIAVG